MSFFGTRNRDQFISSLYLSLISTHFPKKIDSNLAKDLSLQITNYFNFLDDCLKKKDEDLESLFLFVLWSYNRLFKNSKKKIQNEQEQTLLKEQIIDNVNKLNQQIIELEETSPCQKIKNKILEDYIVPTKKFDQQFVSNSTFQVKKIIKTKVPTGYWGYFYDSHRQQQTQIKQIWWGGLENQFFKWFLVFMLKTSFTNNEEQFKSFVQNFFTNEDLYKKLPNLEDRMLLFMMLCLSIHNKPNKKEILDFFSKNLSKLVSSQKDINLLFLDIVDNIHPEIKKEQGQLSKTTLRQTEKQKNISLQPSTIQVQQKRIEESVQSTQSQKPTIPETPSKSITQQQSPKTKTPQIPFSQVTQKPIQQTTKKQISNIKIIPQEWLHYLSDSSLLFEPKQKQDLKNTLILMQERDPPILEKDLKFLYKYLEGLKKVIKIKPINDSKSPKFLKTQKAILTFVIPFLKLIEKNKLNISNILFLLAYMQVFIGDRPAFIQNLLNKETCFSPNIDPTQFWVEVPEKISQNLEEQLLFYKSLMERISKGQIDNVQHCQNIERLIPILNQQKIKKQKQQKEKVQSQKRQSPKKPSTLKGPKGLFQSFLTLQQVPSQTWIQKEKVSQKQQQTQTNWLEIAKNLFSLGKTGAIEFMGSPLLFLVKTVDTLFVSKIPNLKYSKDSEFENHLDESLNKVNLSKVATWILEKRQEVSITASLQIEYYGFIFGFTYFKIIYPKGERHVLILHSFQNNVLRMGIILPKSQNHVKTILLNPDSFQKTLPTLEFDLNALLIDMVKQGLNKGQLSKVFASLPNLFATLTPLVFTPEIQKFYNIKLEVEGELSTKGGFLIRKGLNYFLENILGLKNLVFQIIRLFLVDLDPSIKSSPENIESLSDLSEKGTFSRRILDFLLRRKKKHNIKVKDLEKYLNELADPSQGTTQTKKILNDIVKRYTESQKQKIVRFSSREEQKLQPLLTQRLLGTATQFPYSFGIGEDQISFSDTFVISTTTKPFYIKDSISLEIHKCFFGQVVQCMYKIKSSSQQFSLYLFYGFSEKGMILSYELTNRPFSHLHTFYKKIFQNSTNEENPLNLYDALVLYIPLNQDKINSQELKDELFVKRLRWENSINKIIHMIIPVGSALTINFVKKKVLRIIKKQDPPLSYILIVNIIIQILQHISYYLFLLCFTMFPTYQKIYGFENRNIKSISNPRNKVLTILIEKILDEVFKKREIRDILFPILSIIIFGFMS